MRAGFIGAGKVTGAIGRHLINAGHGIVVSDSSSDMAKEGYFKARKL
jgi:3-hydroxyisobutyrate dehydrogenase-like beta-hydroxyacid dehydrogenase